MLVGSGVACIVKVLVKPGYTKTGPAGGDTETMHPLKKSAKRITAAHEIVFFIIGFPLLDLNRTNHILINK
jgi:hypothetical protein